VPEGQIFNQVYYKEFLTTFREQVRRNTWNVEERLMDMFCVISFGNDDNKWKPDSGGN
jgi:hypothetical protein